MRIVTYQHGSGQVRRGNAATRPTGSKANVLSKAVHRELALACLLLPAFSWAQEEQRPTEQIVVTGTRLANPNLVSTSPIQVVTSEEIAISGRNDVSDILQLLPQNFSNDLGQDLGNRTSGLTTAGGVATADLRGLGPNRTLVLVNGRRLGNGSPLRPGRLEAAVVRQAADAKPHGPISRGHLQKKRCSVTNPP